MAGNPSNLTNAGKGRPKGAVNKSTATMKAAIQSVYDKLQADHSNEKPEDGPHGHFATWAKDNETEFYKLASKLLPIQLTGEDGKAIKVEVTTKEQRDAAVLAASRADK